MRAAPACQFSLRRFGAWRSALLVLAAFGIATTAAWLITHERPLGTVVPMAATAAAATLVALALSLAKAPPADLRWDGRAWHLGAFSGDPVPGEVTVAIDLGPWMLLRFSPGAPDARPRTSWLPIQRRGLESQWHTLRCAVYSPRPGPAEGDGAVDF